MKLKKAQVWKYKSIEDSTPVDISQEITVLVGKNESGKTAFLEALHKAKSLDGMEYNYVADYPRKDLVTYRRKHNDKDYQRVTQLTFQIDEELANKINNEIFANACVIPASTTFTVETS